ncbi:anti-sigma factor [Nocardioides sp.]|uniref:anti-sigma factor n=1 Tax=Nocardioides sp. TaxID=35761 RepID=UPI00271C834F|nr:anti-sigma factor [Nocardioides sp.]MDO9456912.1 anti-sigma factor [Nocardioides sp.]
MSVPSHPVDQSAGRPDVELRLPADSLYASVLRTTTAGLAARLDFTIEDIEDLRIAVGEANAMVLEHADEGSDLVAAFQLAPGSMVVSITVEAATSPVPDLDSFAWQVLTTLAASADIESGSGRFGIVMTMRSSAVGAGS